MKLRLLIILFSCFFIFDSLHAAKRLEFSIVARNTVSGTMIKLTSGVNLAASFARKAFAYSTLVNRAVDLDDTFVSNDYCGAGALADPVIDLKGEVNGQLSGDQKVQPVKLVLVEREDLRRDPSSVYCSGQGYNGYRPQVSRYLFYGSENPSLITPTNYGIVEPVDPN